MLLQLYGTTDCTVKNSKQKSLEASSMMLHNVILKTYQMNLLNLIFQKRMQCNQRNSKENSMLMIRDCSLILSCIRASLIRRGMYIYNYDVISYLAHLKLPTYV